MKLATMNDGSRDGKLAVVSKDLTRYTDASFLVPTLQAALDNWMRVAPHLAAMAESLETGAVPSLRFHEHDAHSPLPRAYQWIDVGAAGPVQRGSDSFAAPRDPIDVATNGGGLHCVAKVAVVIDDLPQGAALDEAREAIRLILLVNDVMSGSASGAEPNGFGGNVTASFSPVAVTPDEIDELWVRSRLAARMQIDLNGKHVDGAKNDGESMDFGGAVFQAAKTRPLGAGTIVSAAAASSGEAVRSLSLGDGNMIRIEMKDKAGHSIFGAIEQTNGAAG